MQNFEWNVLKCIKIKYLIFQDVKKKLTIQNRDDGIGSNSAFFRVYGFFCRT